MPFPIQEEYVQQTEEKINCRLPHYFREKLKVENGGTIHVLGDSWEIYPIYDSSDKNRIKRTCNNLITETEAARKWYGFPDEAIAIGENGSGDRLVLIRQSRSKYGEEVFAWNHETLELISVAKNFEKLNENEA